jgi:hypothetical protein
MRKRLIVAALAATALVVVAGSALAAASQSAVIFDSTVNTGPKSNLPSYGPEAYSAAQIGGEVTLAGTKRKLSSAVVTLSSWACVQGHWTSGCVTPTGAKYSLPITLNIYDASSGQLLTSKTQTFDVSYRPSANPAKCPVPTKWYSTTEKACFNGLAQNVTFTFDGTTTLPNTVRYGITYRTSHHGSTPIGDQEDCNSTLAGCFYDSLNVAVTDAAPIVGTDDLGTLFFNDAGGFIVGDSVYTPSVQFKAIS